MATIPTTRDTTGRSARALMGFALPGFESLLPSPAVAERGGVIVDRFDNGELRVRLESDVGGRACVLVGSVAPPDDQLLALLLAADTLKRQGAAGVRATLPYLGYARQDHVEPGRSLAAAWLGRVLESSGCDGLLTIDLHSDEARRLLNLPLVSLSPAGLFAGALTGVVGDEVVVVAPDEGAKQRAQAVADALGVELPIACFRKERVPDGVLHRGMVGELRRRAIVVDDILDTGGTLISCCRELRTRGVAEIDVVVTHGLFTAERWRELFALGVRILHTTDSVPGARAYASEQVHVHSIVPLLAAGIAHPT